MTERKKHKDPKQVDAMVMYAILKLRKDAVGDTTIKGIVGATKLNDWVVRRSIKRLLNPSQPPPLIKQDARRRYFEIDEDQQITKRGTAWLLEQLISWQQASRDIIPETFRRTLKIPKKVEYLREEGEVEGRMQELKEKGYIDLDIDTDRPETIKVTEKAAQERAYIDLVAKDLPVRELPDYFETTPDNQIKAASPRSKKSRPKQPRKSKQRTGR